MDSILLLLGMLWRRLEGVPLVDYLPWKMERFGLRWYPPPSHCIADISGSNNSRSYKCRECVRKNSEIEVPRLAA
jgi:hypothetical protein